MKQCEIAKKANISESFLSEILNGIKRPRWPKAKILAQITGTKTDLWMEGTPEQLQKAINESDKLAPGLA